jgi:hypothetical protein
MGVYFNTVTAFGKNAVVEHFNVIFPSVPGDTEKNYEFQWRHSLL